MKYQEVKNQLEVTKLNLAKKLENPNLTTDEKESIINSIYNYDYIIELTDMNHYGRG